MLKYMLHTSGSDLAVGMTELTVKSDTSLPAQGGSGVKLTIPGVTFDLPEQSEKKDEAMETGQDREILDLPMRTLVPLGINVKDN